MNDPLEDRIRLLDAMHQYGRIGDRDHEAAIYQAKEAARAGYPLPPLPHMSPAGGEDTFPRASHERWPKIVAAVLVAGVILWIGIAAVRGDKGGSNHANTGSSAKGFVAKISQNANATALDALGLFTEIQAMGTGLIDSSGLYQIASDAKELHDHLFSWREDLLAQVDTSDMDQMDFADAENELKNASGSIQSWAGDPNPARTADVAAQLGNAVHDWNSTVTKLW